MHLLRSGCRSSSNNHEVKIASVLVSRLLLRDDGMILLRFVLVAKPP